MNSEKLKIDEFYERLNAENKERFPINREFKIYYGGAIWKVKVTKIEETKPNRFDFTLKYLDLDPPNEITVENPSELENNYLKTKTGIRENLSRFQESPKPPTGSDELD